MKPLVRWTVGPVSERGFDMLSLAVKSFRRLYGDTFDYYIQHNNLSPQQMLRVKKIGVPLFKQFHTQDMEYEPAGCKWKLYPPRMRLDTHEIVMDNDLILHRKLPEIDRFLADNNTCVITEALKRCYGRYDHLVPPDVQCNVGLYGMPPGYDLATAIMSIQAEDDPRGWQTYFDDQGLITACFYHRAGTILTVSREKVSISLHEEYMPEGSHGVHFVGGNGPAEHKGWSQYAKFRMKLI